MIFSILQRRKLKKNQQIGPTKMTSCSGFDPYIAVIASRILMFISDLNVYPKCLFRNLNVYQINI